MLNNIWTGIVQNWFLVLISLFMLIVGTYAAYKKYGLKRVLLGKKNEEKELIYYKDGVIEWKPTLKSWYIIVTGGMNGLTLFLIFLLLVLSFVYVRDIQATKINSEILCQEFGTVFPTEEQLTTYTGEINLDDLLRVEDEGRERDT